MIDPPTSQLDFIRQPTHKNGTELDERIAAHLEEVAKAFREGWKPQNNKKKEAEKKDIEIIRSNTTMSGFVEKETTTGFKKRWMVLKNGMLFVHNEKKV